MTKKIKQPGWVCPACGCGNAPWAAACNHCVAKKDKEEKWENQERWINSPAGNNTKYKT